MSGPAGRTFCAPSEPSADPVAEADHLLHELVVRQRGDVVIGGRHAPESVRALPAAEQPFQHRFSESRDDCAMRASLSSSAIGATGVLALVAAACGDDGSDDSSATTTTPPASNAPAVIAPTTGPAGLKEIDPAAFQALVDRTMEDMLVPGAVALLRTPQGDVVASYGTTELGAETPPDADTHFRIASITKTMTSAVILLLAEEGKLALDDPVSKYVPEVPNGDNITIAQLLEMRSGLYSYIDAPAISEAMDNDPGKVWTPQELLDIAFAQPAMFAPGADYYYSNTNYVLLGLIIEELDGRPLAESYEQRLWEPLGMTNTTLPAAESSAIPDPYSHGYLYGGASHVMMETPYTPEEAAEAKAGTLQPTDFTDANPSFGWAAGGVISTAADLATWIKALAGGEVLDPEYQQIWQDSGQLKDPNNTYNWYGYGIDQLRWGPNILDIHGGQIPGFNSEAAHDPANDMTLVIWANLTKSLDNTWTAADMMLKALDQIYAMSPIPTTSTTDTTTTAPAG